MIFPLRAPRWALLPQRIRGVFNLNDPRWGRGDEPVGGDGRQGEPKQPDRRPSGSGGQPRTWMSCGVTLIAAFLACLAVGTVVDRANLWVVVVFSQT